MNRNFHRSRSEQVADYLRGCLERGELVEPLPGTRAWCQMLDVSRPTLEEALKILRREGRLVVEPRRPVRIRLRRAAPMVQQPNTLRLVRALYHGTDYPGRSFLDWHPELAERLHAHAIGLTMERCTIPRLRRIAQQGVSSNELFFLASLPVQCHADFARLTHNALILGNTLPESPLSYITIDLIGPIRSAVRWLLRQGITRISLLIDQSRTRGNVIAPAAFEAACAAEKTSALRAEVDRLPLSTARLLPAARRFAARVRPRQGILVVQPVPLGMIMTALLERRLRIPADAVVVGLLTMPEAVQLCPVPPHYPFPTRAFVRQLTGAARHYFETGALLRLQKVLPVTLVNG